MIQAKQAVVLITAASEEQARTIAHLLLNQKIAVCVNIVPKVDSFFWWQGKLDSAQEVLLIVKTKASLVSAIIGTVKKAHSYEVPEIIALPIIAGNEAYLKWLDDVLQDV